MPISIRSPRAAALARELATRRKTTLTAAIVDALEAELQRAKAQAPLAQRLLGLADLVDATGKRRRRMTQAQIDAMWTD